MNKPQKKLVERNDWHECTKWVEQKLGYNTRDTLGKFSGNYDENKHNLEYRDFWHLILDKCEVSNPCEIYLWFGIDECKEEWQKEILQCYLDEFGQGPFWIAW